MNDNTATPLLVSRKDCATLLSLSVRSIDYLIADKRIKTRRVGGSVRIPMTEVHRIARMDFIGSIRPVKTQEVANAA
ncbi:MerR family transcriptional regulator [Granulicella mallensis]|uniref:Helix-turn-helix domain-containing protein n=1 Tax=Granulicella mallensis (strain ATCC BAA-1857 / DSM 23137 / MP5ACTX8) TaxID=682795 RepID=G8NR74_GRAMM|nr:hypothetical protein [Granulicella mallensis]AEU36152.1 hypothetical protein AciX8_1815 [Granulicella mallensis MP5ACTX8]